MGMFWSMAWECIKDIDDNSTRFIPEDTWDNCDLRAQSVSPLHSTSYTAKLRNGRHCCIRWTDSITSEVRELADHFRREPSGSVCMFIRAGYLKKVGRSTFAARS